MEPAVILPCSQGKLDQPTRALELYVGSYFAQLLGYARTLTSDEHLFILSGRYGLIPGDRVIEPYEQVLGRPGSVTRSAVRRQAGELGLRDRDRVIALVGENNGYADTVRLAVPSAEFPMAGIPRGILGRKTWLAEKTRLAVIARG